MPLGIVGIAMDSWCHRDDTGAVMSCTECLRAHFVHTCSAVHSGVLSSFLVPTHAQVAMARVCMGLKYDSSTEFIVYCTEYNTCDSESALVQCELFEQPCDHG